MYFLNLVRIGTVNLRIDTEFCRQPFQEIFIGNSLQVIRCGFPVVKTEQSASSLPAPCRPTLPLMNNQQIIDSASKLPPGKKRVENIKMFVSQNLAGNLHTGVVAEIFKLSRSSLQHMFKKYEAKSYRLYVEEVRMNKAFELLQTEGIRIKEVMYTTGYHNRATFTNAFKKKFGQAPLYYKK